MIEVSSEEQTLLMAGYISGFTVIGREHTAGSFISTATEKFPLATHKHLLDTLCTKGLVKKISTILYFPTREGKFYIENLTQEK